MQRIILRQLKASVHQLEGPEPVSLARYYRTYKKEFRHYQKISDKKELLQAIRRSDIVFGGDFHSFAQSQRTHLRILRDLVISAKAKKIRPVVLALEAIDSADQKHIDDFIKGKIDDRKFLAKTGYLKSWGFPWENYRIFFDLARETGMKIVGVNASHHDRKRGDLELRDTHSAKEIAYLRKIHPEALIYVIYGDLHVAKRHLPDLTRHFLDENDPAEFLTIFQNSESLYWKLAKKRLEEKVDVLQLKPDAYCVVNAPPWMKWQSYLHFLENSVERDVGDTQSATSHIDEVSDLVQMIKEIWKLDGKFTDFQVYSWGDAKIANQLGKKLTKAELQWVERLLKNKKSFFVANPSLIYFAHFGINQAAGFAGQYLHAKMRRERGAILRFPRDFVGSIWTEAIGFFASKIVNHRRKFDTIKDLPQRNRVTLLVLEQRLKEQMAYKTAQPLKVTPPRKGVRALDYFEASRVLGHLLGDKMYTAFRNGDLKISEIHHWLRQPVTDNSRFIAFYMSAVNRLRSVQEQERSKNERL